MRMGRMKSWFKNIVAPRKVEKPEEDKKKLSLEVANTGSLRIWYGDTLIGWINRHGQCKHFEDAGDRALLKVWREEGMPVDDSIMEWRGGEYHIDEWARLERTDGMGGYIYDFEVLRPLPFCEDSNIVRDDEGRAVMFEY